MTIKFNTLVKAPILGMNYYSPTIKYCHHPTNAYLFFYDTLRVGLYKYNMKVGFNENEQ